MTLVAVAVVSKDNRPLAVRTRYDQDAGGGGGAQQEDEARLKLLFLLHSSLDFVEEKQVGCRCRSH